MYNLPKYACGILLLSMLASCATPTAPTESLAVKSDVPVTQSANVMNIVINTKEPMTSSTGEKVICKEFSKPGTRLRAVKRCNTQTGWDLINSETERNIREMYIKVGSDHG